MRRRNAFFILTHPQLDDGGKPAKIPWQGLPLSIRCEILQRVGVSANEVNESNPARTRPGGCAILVQPYRPIRSLR